MLDQTTSATTSIQHINAVVATLVTAHPAAAVRIARGADLVEAGAVERFYGTALVISGSDPSRAYSLVRAGDRWLCDCLDATQRGQGCKHHWACVIYLACERLDAEQNDPTTAPIPYELTPKALAALATPDTYPAA